MSNAMLAGRRPESGGRWTTRGRLARSWKQLTELVKTTGNGIHSLSKRGDRRDKVLLGFNQTGESGGSGSMGSDNFIHPGIKGGKTVLERRAPRLEGSNSLTEGSDLLERRGSGRNRLGRRRRGG